MNSFLATCSIFVWLCVIATQAVSQTTDSNLQAQAEAALVNDDPIQAAAIAQAILSQNPESFPALFVLALAQSDLGEHAQAARTGAQAYDVATQDDTKLQAARLVASARFRLRQYIRAEFWLRRAVNHASTNEEQLDVAREYLRTVNANPLTLQFTAFAAPSDNINNGSEDGILSFETIGLSFELPENRRALSGIAFAASARAEYRLEQTSEHRSSLTAFAAGETFRLSSEARDLLDSSPNPDVRDVEGSDFATLVAELGFTHRQNNLSPIGPIIGSVNFGTYWEGGERLLNYQDLILQQVIPINAKNAVSLRASKRDQQALIPQLVDSESYDLLGSYTRILSNNDRLQLSLAWRKNDAGFENLYYEYRAGLGYSFAEPLFNTRWSTTFEAGYRTYDEFTTTLDGRRDRFASAQIDAVFEEITYFGFSPSMSISAERTESSAEEITSGTFQVLLGIESNF